MQKTKPVLRWAGGKSWLANSIAEYLPEEFNDYHEPFVGGASIFLHLKNENYIKRDSFLSDSNEELINAYQIIKNDLYSLNKVLKTYLNEEGFYYKMRSATPETPLLKAARFIYLNRTSFNGIYRENSKGEYNVPFGYRKLSTLFDYNVLSDFCAMLQNTNLSSCDFEETLINVKSGDLVFLDPPYTVAHENNGFIKYNKKIFSWNDQERLRKYIQKIVDIGAYYILTNAAHFSIDNLYFDIGKKAKLARSSTIGGKGAKRDKYNEYLFFNSK